MSKAFVAAAIVGVGLAVAYGNGRAHTAPSPVISGGDAVVVGPETGRDGMTMRYDVLCRYTGTDNEFTVLVASEQAEYAYPKGALCPPGPRHEIGNVDEIQRELDRPLPYKVPANPDQGDKTVPDSYDPGFWLRCDYGMDFPSLPEAQEHWRECFPGQNLPPNLR